MMITANNQYTNDENTTLRMIVVIALQSFIYNT